VDGIYIGVNGIGSSRALARWNRLYKGDGRIWIARSFHESWKNEDAAGPSSLSARMNSDFIDRLEVFNHETEQKSLVCFSSVK
jgi:hypothetical protein